jgi:mRNA-degrading endonuclease RelE of RelBE toxin-antitoxin system
MPNKKISVRGSKDFAQFYQSLPSANELNQVIDNAMDLLKTNPLTGNRIEKKLWPKQYKRKYAITNLYRYRLSSNYRMIYTVVSDENETVCSILEVLDHKMYDKIFGYATS